MTFICYKLTCRLFGDTYIGVTGQPIRRRELQHYRSDRFPDGFALEVIGEATSREEINRIERQMIALHKPTLNRLRGGNSAGGYASKRKPDVYCVHGHEFTPENTVIRANGRRRCLKCKRAEGRDGMRRMRLAKRDD